MIAATLAAGASAYGLTGTSHPDPARLTAALSAPTVVGAFTHSGIGKSDAAASILTHPRHPAGSAGTRSPAPTASAGRRAAGPARSAATARATTPATTPAATRPTAPQDSRSPAPVPTAAAVPSATPSASPAASTVSCSSGSSLLPANVTAIVSFLLANGYSGNAAAGIAGNIYQESKGDPESVGMGGGGLIGWTPLPSGFVTGNPAADLQTQLNAILTYNNGWSAYLSALNSAATPADAAYIYVTDFERAGIPAASTREASAQAVASACNI